jgi:hypothetical protein
MSTNAQRPEQIAGDRGSRERSMSGVRFGDKHMARRVTRPSKVDGRSRLGLFLTAILATFLVCGCGSTRGHAPVDLNAGVPVGGGQTAAGTMFRALVERPSSAAASHREAGSCPLNVDIDEGSHKGYVPICYSRLENPVRARVECVAGLLTVHAQLQDAARWVRLNLSNHQQVTSPTILVPRKLGGPAAIYYQALRGPRPIPLSLTEIDDHGHILGVMSSPRVVECTSQLIHYKARQAKVLAKVPAPNGNALTITYQPYRSLGTDGYSLQAALGGRESRVVGSGALRVAIPLEWEVKRICGSSAYALVYGILASQNDRVFVRSDGVHPLREVTVSATVLHHSLLVYGFEKLPPSALIVREPDGATLVDRDVKSIVAQTPCS